MTELSIETLQDRKLLTVEELAQNLRVEKSWVYARTRETGNNTMPRLKVGKYLRFVMGDILKWLECQNQLERGGE